MVCFIHFGHDNGMIDWILCSGRLVSCTIVVVSRGVGRGSRVELARFGRKFVCYSSKPFGLVVLNSLIKAFWSAQVQTFLSHTNRKLHTTKHKLTYDETQNHHDATLFPGHISCYANHQSIVATAGSVLCYLS